VANVAAGLFQLALPGPCLKHGVAVDQAAAHVAVWDTTMVRKAEHTEKYNYELQPAVIFASVLAAAGVATLHVVAPVDSQVGLTAAPMVLQ